MPRTPTCAHEHGRRAVKDCALPRAANTATGAENGPGLLAGMEEPELVTKLVGHGLGRAYSRFDCAQL